MNLVMRRTACRPMTYPWLPGPNVSRDFVESPRRLYESCLQPPDLLRCFVLGPGTDEPIPPRRCIPSKSNRKIPVEHDRTLYRQRHKIGASGSPLVARLPAPHATHLRHTRQPFDAQIADVAIGPIEARESERDVLLTSDDQRRCGKRP
jgi:hypothetical protein